MPDATEIARGPWRVAIWDRPQGGARYCVRQADSNAYDGWEYAHDGRNGVAAFYSRRVAEMHAEHLNAALRARAAQEAQGDAG